MNDEKRKILEELLIDEIEILRRLVKKAKNIINITSESGNIIIRNKEMLSIPEIITLYAIGKYFASELGKVETPAVTPKEIAKKFGLKENVVSVRCSELKSEGILEKKEQGYVIDFSKIEGILDEVLSKIRVREEK